MSSGTLALCQKRRQLTSMMASRRALSCASSTGTPNNCAAHSAMGSVIVESMPRCNRRPFLYAHSRCLVFVHPWPYRLAMVPFRDTKLHPDHIVVLGSLERLVAETMSGCKGAWLKAPDVLQRNGSQAETAREGRIQSMRAMRAAGLPHRQAPSTNSSSASGALTCVL